MGKPSKYVVVRYVEVELGAGDAEAYFANDELEALLILKGLDADTLKNHKRPRLYRLVESK
jgi:hypothetical protein